MRICAVVKQVEHQLAVATAANQTQLAQHCSKPQTANATMPYESCGGLYTPAWYALIGERPKRSGDLGIAGVAARAI